VSAKGADQWPAMSKGALAERLAGRIAETLRSSKRGRT